MKTIYSWMILLLLGVLVALAGGQDALVAQEPEPADGRVMIIDRVVEANGAVRATAVLEPEQDSFVASARNTTRFGASDELRVGYDSVNGAQQILMRFNLVDDLPDEATNIMTATLTLFVQDHSPAIDPPMVIPDRMPPPTS